MQDKYIAYINEKHHGTMVVDPFKKTYGRGEPYLNGKLSSRFAYQEVPVVFTMNISNHSKPYSAAFKISSDFPTSCTLIPRRKIFQLINANKSRIKRRYRASIDSSLLMNIESNERLLELLDKWPTHIVIQKKETHRLLVIRPWFSVLSLRDFQLLELITIEFISCFSTPRLH